MLVSAVRYCAAFSSSFVSCLTFAIHPLLAWFLFCLILFCRFVVSLCNTTVTSVRVSFNLNSTMVQKKFDAHLSRIITNQILRSPTDDYTYTVKITNVCPLTRRELPPVFHFIPIPW